VDPVSALVIAFIIGTAIMRSAGQAAADQARAEARRAADTVRADLRGRRTAAARRLNGRLDAGRAAGPAYPMWWAWAAVRGAGALRRAARQRRRPAEQRRGPARSTTGPLGRILGAALRGAAYGWGESRRQYRDYRRGPQGRPGPQGQPRPVAVGVCERCGAAVAIAALAVAPTRLGRRVRMCARCRAVVGAERQADADAARAAEPAPEPAGTTDAELVDGPAEVPAGEMPDAVRQIPAGGVAACTRCGEPLVAFGCANPECPLCAQYRGPLAAEGAPDPAQFRLPVRYCAGCRTQLSPHTWWARSADNADVCLFCARGSGGRPGRYPDGACRERGPAELAAMGTPLDARGEPAAMSPQTWAQIAAPAALAASAAASAAAAAGDSRPDSPAGPHDQAAAPAALPALPAGDDMSCNGEMHTQADWADQSAGILGQLDGIVASSENMLKCLTAREASRSQMTAAAAWADQVAAVASRGRELVAEVNQRQDPYVDAVQGAGGSDEVAVPDYYAEL
jgi:hypothetical protein